MKISDSITINAPVEKVFNVFTDLENASKNVTEITEIKIIEGPSSMAVGTKWRETRKMMGKEATEEMWVSELVPNKSYVVEADSRGVKYRTDYTFVQKAKQTEVTMVFSGIVSSPVGRFFAKIMFVFMKGMTQKALHKDLEDLKAVAEKNTVSVDR